MKIERDAVQPIHNVCCAVRVERTHCPDAEIDCDCVLGAQDVAAPTAARCKTIARIFRPRDVTVPHWCSKSDTLVCDWVVDSY